MSRPLGSFPSGASRRHSTGPRPWLPVSWRGLQAGQRRRRGLQEPLLECKDMVVQNALYTGNLSEVQRHFSEHAEVNLLIQARSHDLRWTSHKWEMPVPAWGARGKSDQLSSPPQTASLVPPPRNANQAAPLGDHTRGTEPMEPISTRRAQGTMRAFWQALLAGDGDAVLCLLADPRSGVGPNAVFDTSDLDGWKDYRFNSRCLRLWALTYEQELTSPLHITAERGYLDCLRHLLLRGGDVDLAPGGQTALHVACAAATTDCARLLLSFGAEPGAVSAVGFQPLHLCRSPVSLECAQLLLREGADVNAASEEEEDTPMHVAARLGLAEHVRLFLRHGANLEARNAEGQTPLNAACAQPHSPQASDAYEDVCRQLLDAGACVDAPDEDRQRPLHQACKTADARLVALLLARGAAVNIMSYSGNTALHNILQVAAYKREHRPELAVRALLNHGAVRVWPGALLKVLRHCCACPRSVEVLLNCYERVPVTEAWAEAVPAELVQQHPRFFRSLFALGRGPRALQHLARCALRRHLEDCLPQGLAALPLPPPLLEFLLLCFEDVLY